jgi:hypothetical protein
MTEPKPHHLGRIAIDVVCGTAELTLQKILESNLTRGCRANDHVTVTVMGACHVMLEVQQVLAEWQGMVSFDEWRMHMRQVLLQPLLSLLSTPQSQDLAAKRLECIGRQQAAAARH